MNTSSTSPSDNSLSSSQIDETLSTLALSLNETTALGVIATVEEIEYTALTPPQRAKATILKAGALRLTGNTAQAIQTTVELAQLYPNQPQVQTQAGILLAECGAHAQAIAPLQRAVHITHSRNQLDPTIAFQLGVAAQHTDDQALAINAFSLACSVAPQLKEAWVNWGNSALAIGDLAQAKFAANSAVNTSPDFSYAHNLLGICHLRESNWQLALKSFTQAVALDDAFLSAWKNLAAAAEALNLNDVEDAAHSRVVQLLESQPALSEADETLRSAAQFRLNALRGQTTQSVPSEFVEHLFDNMATNFDEHLQQHLAYQIPTELVALLIEHKALPIAPSAPNTPNASSTPSSPSLPSLPNANEQTILDLGCGTGLFAKAMVDAHIQSAPIIGCDLSENMLAIAKKTELYQSLKNCDLIEFLAQQTNQSAHLIVATDVFVYVGDLRACFKEAARVLTPSGWFAFSAEAGLVTRLAEEQLPQAVLQTSGRFAHSPAYITSLAAQKGFNIQALRATTIREERGAPIGGHIYLLQQRV